MGAVDNKPPKVPEAEKPAELDPTAKGRMLAKRPHEIAMEDIIERRGLNGPNEEETTVEVKTEPKAKAPPEPKLEVTTEPAAEPAAEVVTAPAKIKQVVDGESYEVDQADIDEAGGERAWRIQKASENRLREAKEAKEESKKLMAALTGLLEKQPKEQAKAVEPEDTAKYIAGKLQQLRFGSDEEGAAVLMEVVKKLTPSQPNQQAMVAHVRAHLKWESAMESFTKDFPEVVSNPVLVDLVETLDRKARAELKPGQMVDWHNHYRTIGNKIRTLVPAGQSQPATSADTTTGTPSKPSEKEARKASITVLPTSSARAEAPKEEKEPSPEEARKQWFDDARKSRGQAG